MWVLKAANELREQRIMISASYILGSNAYRIVAVDPFEQQLVQKVTGKMMEVVENKATPLMIDR